MTRRVDLLPLARLEVEDAFRYYERSRPGLGLEFLLALEAAIRRIGRDPLAYPAVGQRTRKALMRRFPYAILFAVYEDRVLVTSVFHGRRDPRRWENRAREALPAYSV